MVVKGQAVICCCGASARGVQEKTRGSKSVVPSVGSLVADLAEGQNKAEEGPKEDQGSLD